MSGPARVAARRLFEFIGRAELAVVLVSAHRAHRFSPALARALERDHPGVALGRVDMRDLLFAGGPTVRFLHQGLRACGAPAQFGVVPGYCLFRGGAMLAWDPGLPALADVAALARGALLGVVWSGLTRDAAFVRRALRLAADQAAAERTASRFRGAAAREAPGSGDDAGGAPRHDDVYWAYQMLGVLPTATDREVYQAWRRRRVENHPDHAAQDPVEFARRSRLSAEINRAREIIEAHRAGRSGGERAAAS